MTAVDQQNEEVLESADSKQVLPANAPVQRGKGKSQSVPRSPYLYGFRTILSRGKRENLVEISNEGARSGQEDLV